MGHLAKPKQGTTVLHLRIFPLPAAVQAFAATSSTRLSHKSFDSIKHHNTEGHQTFAPCQPQHQDYIRHYSTLPVEGMLLPPPTEYTFSVTIAIRSHHILDKSAVPFVPQFKPKEAFPPSTSTPNAATCNLECS